MTAGTACDNLKNPVARLMTVYSDEMREWVKWESPDDCSDAQVLDLVKDRFHAPYPSLRSIDEWRKVAQRERAESRRRVYERQFAQSAGYLVPKVLVALDRALDTATEALGRAREAKNDKAVPSLTKAVVACASEMLTHLGAPTHAHEADPEAIRREALAALMAAGQSAAEAEAVLAVFAAGPVAALEAGDEAE